MEDVFTVYNMERFLIGWVFLEIIFFVFIISCEHDKHVEDLKKKLPRLHKFIEDKYSINIYTRIYKENFIGLGISSLILVLMSMNVFLIENITPINHLIIILILFGIGVTLTVTILPRALQIISTVSEENKEEVKYHFFLNFHQMVKDAKTPKLEKILTEINSDYSKDKKILTEELLLIMAKTLFIIEGYKVLDIDVDKEKEELYNEKLKEIAMLIKK